MKPIQRLIEIYRDINHAQQRMFELRTGVRVMKHRH
jgi:hypothetical protein